MEIKIHAEKNCIKLLQPDDDFSPTIQMWYDRIHAYLQLIWMKEGKMNNTRNILRYARQQHINKPEELTMEKLQDVLQFAWIREADIQKQAKRLRKVHPQNCLINAMEKKQKSCAAAIKQKINRKAKAVVPHQMNSERSTEPKHVKSPKNHQRQSKGVQGAGGRPKWHPTKMQGALLSGSQCTNNVHSSPQMPMLPF